MKEIQDTVEPPKEGVTMEVRSKKETWEEHSQEAVEQELKNITEGGDDVKRRLSRTATIKNLHRSDTISALKRKQVYNNDCQQFAIQHWLTIHLSCRANTERERQRWDGERWGRKRREVCPTSQLFFFIFFTRFVGAVDPGRRRRFVAKQSQQWTFCREENQVTERSSWLGGPGCLISNFSLSKNTKSLTLHRLNRKLQRLTDMPLGPGCGHICHWYLNFCRGQIWDTDCKKCKLGSTSACPGSCVAASVTAEYYKMAAAPQ